MRRIFYYIKALYKFDYIIASFCCKLDPVIMVNTGLTDFDSGVISRCSISRVFGITTEQITGVSQGID